jgi:hypothetical protein
MNKNQSHEWNENDPELGKRIFRATWEPRPFKWRIQVTLKSEPEWHEIEHPDIELHEKLREVLFNKYQRKKLNIKYLVHLDKLIADRRRKVIDKAAAK